jgi:hypothetical protein
MWQSHTPLTQPLKRPLPPQICLWRGQERCAYNWLAPNGDALAPMSVESCGHFCKTAVGSSGMQATEAAAAGDVGKSSSAAMALRELSVGVCKGNYLMHQPLLGVLAGVADQGFRPGADRLTKDTCD